MRIRTPLGNIDKASVRYRGSVDEVLVEFFNSLTASHNPGFSPLAVANFLLIVSWATYIGQKVKDTA